MAGHKACREQPGASFWESLPDNVGFCGTSRCRRPIQVWNFPASYVRHSDLGLSARNETQSRVCVATKMRVQGYDGHPCTMDTPCGTGIRSDIIKAYGRKTWASSTGPKGTPRVCLGWLTTSLNDDKRASTSLYRSARNPLQSYHRGMPRLSALLPFTSLRLDPSLPKDNCTFHIVYEEDAEAYRPDLGLVGTHPPNQDARPHIASS